MPRRSFGSFTVLPLFILFSWIQPIEAQQPSGSGANNALTPSEAAAGWILLFNGRTLSGFTTAGDADWKVEDGALTATKGSGFLITPRRFGNFELKVDFWADSAVNSGVFVRCGEGTPSPLTCYEAQIEGAATGSLVLVQDVPANMPDPTGRWNTYEITADGDHLIVKLNGRTTADGRDQKLVTGTVALQEGGLKKSGLVRFRNVKIRPF